MRNSALARAAILMAVAGMQQSNPYGGLEQARRRQEREREEAEDQARHQAAVEEGKRKMAAAQAKRDRKAKKRATQAAEAGHA